MTNLDMKQKVRLNDLNPDEFFEDDKQILEHSLKSDELRDEKKSTDEKEIQP